MRGFRQAILLPIPMGLPALKMKSQKRAEKEYSAQLFPAFFPPRLNMLPPPVRPAKEFRGWLLWGTRILQAI